jgi:formiminotetrahydrofolate cyclodeaminase
VWLAEISGHPASGGGSISALSTSVFSNRTVGYAISEPG